MRKPDPLMHVKIGPCLQTASVAFLRNRCVANLNVTQRNGVGGLNL